MKLLPLVRRALSAVVVAPLALGASVPALAATAATTVDLTDSPLFSSISVPGNLLLALSVEYPTANTVAYPSSTAYATASTFLGYFDSEKCYSYTYNSAAPSSSYFTPSGAASSHVCSNAWSGNWLNWASMQSLDEFRWVLTGGNRSTDSATKTILTKTYHSGQDSGGSAPNKSMTNSGSGTAATIVQGATPLPSATTTTSVTTGTGRNATTTTTTYLGWTTLASRIWGTGIRMFITNTAGMSGSASGLTVADYDPGASTPPDGAKIYVLYMNVQVCVVSTSFALENNCVQYGTTYKPEGLMQSYSSKLRYSAFGYLNDGNVLRDGGVMRAGMKYIGPTQPVPGSAAVTNSLAEWDSTTGIMATNPNPTDASTTTSATTAAGNTVTISQSGVMNYLNKFGYDSSTYKTYDPVSEMYYAATRYLRGLANVPEYSSLSGGGTSIKTWLDGFPVVTSWDDPIIYTCQKNFILGIGDVNTHRDADLPGSSLYSANYTAGQEPGTPSLVTSDTGVNVDTATDMVGHIENGGTTLGSTYVSSGRYDTYYVAGLAYDAHTTGVRTFTSTNGTTTVSTVNTYWLDVLENQTHIDNNIYYYATKYGGFTVPTGFKPYGANNAKNTLDTTNGNVTLTDAMWHTTSDTNGNNKRPDNYFTANNADVMKTSLTNAFAKISSEAGTPTSTAFSTPTANVAVSGSVSYSATYDATNWTGVVIASTVTYNLADGSATNLKQWDARQLLSAATVTPTTRYIVTCCNSSTATPGMQFTDAALSATGVISRTYYASFGAVPGVATGDQSKTNFLAYLRGDTTQEVANGGHYRTRAYRLGDIVDSKPVAVAAPSEGLFDVYNSGYSAFKSAQSGRNTIVYVGANDGMLHAFDGSVGNTTSGAELFAYIPSFVYGTSSTASTSGLASLGNPTFSHHFLVDSTPAVYDVNFSLAGTATTTGNPDWRTVLIGGLGKGGNGYYALDITDPTTWSSESAVAGKVLWEFTGTHMGYTYGLPTVVKTKKYGWVVVMTSGYNNDDGIGYFYFVNPKTGLLLESVKTTTGSPSVPINMAQHSAFVPDTTDGTADAIYGVDGQGGIWRLDVTGTTGSYPSPVQIATLADSLGNAQPITTRPLIQSDSSTTTRYILVGTGRLLGNSDITSAKTQSFYAIIDGTTSFGGFYTSGTLPTGVTFPITRGKLNQITNLVTGLTTGNSTSSMGWYYDMPLVGGIAPRVNIDPKGYQAGGLVAWAGNVPNGQACNPAGSQVDYVVAYGTAVSVLGTQSTVNNITTTTMVPSVTDSSSTATEIEFMNTDGTVNARFGNSGGTSTGYGDSRAKTTVAKQLNWRDVPLGN